MSERVNYAFLLKEIANSIITTDRRLALQPGLYMLHDPVAIFRLKRNINLWTCDLNWWDPVRQQNCKDYFLRSVKLSEVLMLIKMGDYLITALGVTDDELRKSIKRGAEERQNHLVIKIDRLLEFSGNPTNGMTPEMFKKIFSIYATELNDLKVLKGKLFERVSNLPRS